MAKVPKVKYIFHASLPWGRVSLLRLQVIERAKTYKVLDQEPLVGEESYRNILDKRNAGLYDDPVMAVRYLIQRLEEEGAKLRDRQRANTQNVKQMWELLEELQDG